MTLLSGKGTEEDYVNLGGMILGPATYVGKITPRSLTPFLIGEIPNLIQHVKEVSHHEVGTAIVNTTGITKMLEKTNE
jgi:polynucleotide 5'-kinase involved in rRNA processing